MCDLAIGIIELGKRFFSVKTLVRYSLHESSKLNAIACLIYLIYKRYALQGIESEKLFIEPSLTLN